MKFYRRKCCGAFPDGNAPYSVVGKQRVLVHHKIYMTKKEEYGIIKIYVL